MLFNKKKKWEPDQYLIDILDAQDADVVIVRGRECKVLFMNSSARKRIRLSALPSYSCKNGYSKIFPRLCHVCSHMEESVARRLPPEIEDQSGNNMFNVLSNPIEWSDGRSATMLMLRDVSEFRNNERKLYHLAYIDQLTGVPNRTRFREDFDNIIDDVNAGKYCGALAIFDLDNFKTINDNYGHATGDTMLQRLAEHLENNANFSGKIYRLGGDEFVILLMEEAKKFPNYEHLRQYYKNIFQDALQSYTMPDIDSACTISMGISFFPQHGRRMSELLRKSDIALYKAKSAGRNRLEIFHDRYDTVKRPKDLYVNMQPILDDTGQTYGYELIDRGNDGQTDYNTVSLSEFNRTLDALGLEDIENDSKFFITFTNQLFHISVRNNLSKDKYITLINAASIKKAEDINLCRDLRKFGYSIALTGIQSADTELLDIVDYCKFEKDAFSESAENAIIQAHPDLIFIASSVNTLADFHRAKERGFSLFQGFFFNQAAVTKNTKEIDPIKANYYRLLKLTCVEGYVDFRAISQIISSDVALSYKLLRLLNSTAVGLQHKVSSISMAVAYLGEESLKRWILLLALRGLGDGKPLELIRMSLIRARFGELLALHFRPRRNPDTVFLIGMFSLLHIALEKSQKELFTEIPIATHIYDSLATPQGPYSDMLPLFSNYEYANWEDVTRFAHGHHIETHTINEAYMSAVKWCNDLMRE